MSSRKISDSTSRATSAPSGGSAGISENENVSEILRYRYKLFISKNILSFATLFGIFLGCILGFTFKYSPLFGEDYWTPRRLSYVYLPGELFLSSLSCLYAPTLISSLMAAVGSLETKAFRFVLWRSIIHICVSTVAATAMGVLLLLIVNPGSPKDHPLHPICFEKPIASNGNGSNMESYCTKDGHPCRASQYDTHMWSEQTELRKRPPPATGNISYCSDTYIFAFCRIFEDGVMDVIRGYFPSNIIETFLSTSRMIPDLSSPVDPNAPRFEGEDSCLQYARFPSNSSKPSLWDFNTKIITVSSLNLNGFITYFIFVALAALAKPESGRPTLNFVTSLSECTLKMGTWIIWLSPIFVTSLLAGHIVEEASVFDFPATIYYYLLTCILGLLLHTLVVLPLVYYAFLRKFPFQFYKQLLPVVLIKFGTPSRSSTFPVTIDFLETVCNLDPRIVRLVIPFGSQINLPGTAICTVIAVGYISQLHGVDLDLSNYQWLMIYVFLIITIAPFGDTHIKNSFFTRRINVGLASVGLPTEFRFYVASIAWIIDGLAPVTNMLADCVGCAVIQHLSLSVLENVDDISAKSSVRGQQEPAKNSSGGKKSNTGPAAPIPVPVTAGTDIRKKVVNDATVTKSDAPKTIQQQSNLLNDSARKKRRIKSKSSSLAKSGSPSLSMKSKYSKKSETVENIGGGASKPKQSRIQMASSNSKKDWNTSTQSQSTPKSSSKSSNELTSASKTSGRSRTASKSKSKVSDLFATSKSPSKRSQSKSKSKSKSKNSTN